MTFKDHNLTAPLDVPGLRYEERGLRDPDGREVPGLHTVHITLDNPGQLNSYTTAMVKGVILGMRRASNDRAAVAVVFTGSGTRAFCTGGNTAEYAEYYAGRPEIGMACDFTVAQDLAMFGQAGPRHGSAPDGGSTDLLPLFVGIEAAMESCTLCEPWSAHKAMRLGLVTKIVPALKVNGAFVPNPLVVTDRWMDGGEVVFGEPKTGAEREAAKKLLVSGEIDLSSLDRAVDGLVWKLANTFPGCLTKTLESVRKHKLEHWDRNRESNRAWLALNMMTEGRAGFRAFHEGSKACREADFLLLRRRLAEGAVWDDALTEEIIARAHAAV
jgi:6-oxo-cyclohex-1-ene-carbonyl-CoA hydrolase